MRACGRLGVSAGTHSLMERNRTTCDVVPGSTWIGINGVAHVLDVSAGYVRHSMGSVVCTMHHTVFRQQFSPTYDARQIRSQFSMTAKNLVTFHAFWSPSLRHAFYRSSGRDPDEAFKPSRGSPAIPPDCIHVGTYDDRATTSRFLEDLHDVIACISRRIAA